MDGRPSGAREAWANGKRLLRGLVSRNPGAFARASGVGVALASIFGGYLLEHTPWLAAPLIALAMVFGWQVDEALIEILSNVRGQIRSAVRQVNQDELLARLKEHGSCSPLLQNPSWAAAPGVVTADVEFYWGCAIYLEHSDTTEVVVEYRSTGSVPTFKNVDLRTPAEEIPASFGGVGATGTLATKALTVGSGLSVAVACFVPGRDDLKFGKVDASATNLRDAIESDVRTALLIDKILVSARETRPLAT